ncbi:hypothetical protein PMAYCL1PPCAC_05161, partial [Pristionchus mayeri]
QFFLANDTPNFLFSIDLATHQVDKRRQFAGSFYTEVKLDSPDGASSVLIYKIENPFDSTARAKLVYREIHLMRTLKHENIVKLLRTYKDDNEQNDSQSIYYITDFCGVRLGEKIVEGRYSMVYVKKWTTELLRAVAYLHSKGIIHGNLHPGNMCIDATNKLTITGFGSSHESIIDPLNHETAVSESISIYMPIEQLTGWSEAYDEKVDIWSISIILWELLTGKPLFD